MIGLRLATLADAPLLPAIERSAGEAFRGTVHERVAEDDIMPEAAYRPLIAAGQVRVAEMDGEVVGYVRIGQCGDELHVFELDVRHDRQGRGVGKALMDAARGEAVARGCKAMTLTTFTNLPFNAPFYARLGFEILASPRARLAEILVAETARGLDDRCAMRLVL